jgi:hypothetical protein
MTLSTGTKLGPYEIFTPLGAGGIGEVHGSLALSAGCQGTAI